MTVGQIPKLKDKMLTGLCRRPPTPNQLHLLNAFRDNPNSAPITVSRAIGSDNNTSTMQAGKMASKWAPWLGEPLPSQIKPGETRYVLLMFDRDSATGRFTLKSDIADALDEYMKALA